MFLLSFFYYRESKPPFCLHYGKSSPVNIVYRKINWQNPASISAYTQSEYRISNYVNHIRIIIDYCGFPLLIFSVPEEGMLLQKLIVRTKLENFEIEILFFKYLNINRFHIILGDRKQQWKQDNFYEMQSLS